MKKTILFITSLVLIVGIAKSQTVNIDDLIINQEDGLYYKEGSDNPLSGKVVYTEGGGSTTRFTSEGMTVTKNPIIKIFEIKIKDGKIVSDYKFFDKDKKIKKPINIKMLQTDGDYYISGEIDDGFKKVEGLESIVNLKYKIPYDSDNKISYRIEMISNNSFSKDRLWFKYYDSNGEREYSGKVFLLGSNGRKILEGTLYRGQWVGLWKLSTESGEIIKTINYSMINPGVFHGETREYYSNGQVQSISHYRDKNFGHLSDHESESNEKPVGEWIDYNESGEVIKKRDFEYFNNNKEFVKGNWWYMDGYYYPDTSGCLSPFPSTNPIVLKDTYEQIDDSTYLHYGLNRSKKRMYQQFVENEDYYSEYEKHKGEVFKLREDNFFIKKDYYDFNRIEFYGSYKRTGKAIFTLYRLVERKKIVFNHQDLNGIDDEYSNSNFYTDIINRGLLKQLKNIYKVKYNTSLPLHGDLTLMDKNQKIVFEGSFSYGQNLGNNIFYDNDGNVLYSTDCSGFKGIDEDFLISKNPWVPLNDVWQSYGENHGLDSISFSKDYFSLFYNEESKFEDNKVKISSYGETTCNDKECWGVFFPKEGHFFDLLNFLSINFSMYGLTPVIRVDNPYFEKETQETNGIRVSTGLNNYILYYVPLPIISWLGTLTERMSDN